MGQRTEDLLGEAQLFEEKERARVTLDSIGDAVLSTDIEGQVSCMNAAAETLTGFSRLEATGRPWRQTLSPANHCSPGAPCAT